MGCSVRELLARFDSEELSVWLARERIEPLPDSWTQAALIASTVANAMGGGKKRFTVEDFMPVTGKSPAKQKSPEEMKAIMGRLVATTANRKPA